MGANHPSSKTLNKEELTNTHPFQQNSVIVEQANKRYIQSSFKVCKQEYEKWRKDVQTVSLEPHSQFAYLPTDLGYVENSGICSKNGYAVVPSSLSRPTTPSTPSYSPTKSSAAKQTIPISKKRSCTISSTPWWPPRSTPRPGENHWETSSPETSSSVEMSA
jgi:hypothetical protein